MDILDLSSTSWSLSDGTDHLLQARVPGSALGALICADVLQDPLSGQEEKAATWVDERAWTWQRDIELPVQLLAHDRIELHADGIDVLSEVMLGTHRLGRTANRFRSWRWDVRKLLHCKARQLRIICAPATPELRRRSLERDLYGVASPIERLPTGWIRTAACQFGWDWGPRASGCALRGRIALVAWSIARLDQVEVRQHHHQGGVDLELIISVRRARPDALHADIAIDLAGHRVVATSTAIDADSLSLRMAIPDAQLWWPRGMGAQPLYAITVSLRSGEEVLERWMRQIGLRELHLERERDSTGESFGFSVNGRAFVAHGANWVPPHPIPERCDPQLRERLFSAMTAAHFNMLRIWGGGVYEDDAFYERCDELGILVWQDLMLACAHVPLHDEAWVEDFLLEVRDQVGRLRHHPCLALWCGNNEFEMDGVSWVPGDGRMHWDDYRRLFDHRLPELIMELDPQRGWWPCSPHTPLGDRGDYRNVTCGDSHPWDVWAHQHPLASVAMSTPRFVSEFGFQSLPEVSTLARVMPLEQIRPGHPAFEHRQRGGPGATARIMEEIRTYLPLPQGAAELARASQIVQGIYLDLAIRTWRRRPGRCRGQLYWQLNDTWACISWSTVDYSGVWKLSHAVVARAFAPLLLTMVPLAASGLIEVALVDDRVDGSVGGASVSWSAIACRDGKVLRNGLLPVGSRKLGVQVLGTLDLSELRKNHHDGGFLVRCECRFESGEVVRQHAAFARPCELNLADPQLELQVDPTGMVQVRARTPAYAVWVEADGSLLPDVGQGDWLLPGETWTLNARAPASSVLRVMSLHDLASTAVCAPGDLATHGINSG